MGALALASLAYSIHHTAADPAAAYFVTPDPRVGVRRGRPARAARRPTAGRGRARARLVARARRDRARGRALQRRHAVPRHRGGAPGRRRARRHLGGGAEPRCADARAPALPRRHLLLGLPVALAAARPRALSRPAARWTPSRPSRCSCSRSCSPGSPSSSSKTRSAPGALLARAAPAGRSPAPAPRPRSCWSSAVGGQRTAAASTSARPSAPRSICSPTARLLRRGRPRPASIRCENPKLRLTVVPSPIEAHKQRNSPVPEDRAARRCLRLRVRRAAGKATDDGRAHRRQPRRALARGARRRRPRARRWAGVSLSHTGCPLSKATKNLPQPRRDECVEWNRQVLAVVRAPPRGHDGLRLADLRRRRRDRARPRPARRAARRATSRPGRRCRASVKQIVVLRDTPKVARRHRHVRAGGDARATGAPVSPARPARRTALTPDSAAVAARALRSPRVQRRRPHALLLRPPRAATR